MQYCIYQVGRFLLDAIIYFITPLSLYHILPNKTMHYAFLIIFSHMQFAV